MPALTMTLTATFRFQNSTANACGSQLRLKLATPEAHDRDWTCVLGPSQSLRGVLGSSDHGVGIRSSVSFCSRPVPSSTVEAAVLRTPASGARLHCFPTRMNEARNALVFDSPTWTRVLGLVPLENEEYIPIYTLWPIDTQREGHEKCQLKEMS